MAATHTNIDSELRTLARFVELYCHDHHADAPRTSTRMKTHDVAAICGREVELCDPCSRLLMHAFVKRSHCPIEPKPMCKACPNHCYAPAYRAQIREVMKYSGRKMVLRGRLDYLLHLLR